MSALPKPQAELLKATSRSFYLTLRMFPKGIRGQIGIAYLLARTTDTIADTEIIPAEQRLKALEFLRVQIMEVHRKPVDFGEFAKNQGNPAERMLLERVEESLDTLDSFNSADQARIRKVLEIIVSGQELDLRRFMGASAERVVALKSEEELDDYTYRVAGCAGEFLTRMFRTYAFPAASLDEAKLYAGGINFGKGLQLVNILRDLPVDLRQGRCYLPEGELAAAGLKPEELLQSANMGKFRPVYQRYLAKAEERLRAGWNYTNMLPKRCVRIKLACAWPALIGIETLRKLRTANVLDASERVKISRPEVRNVMMRTVLYYTWQPGWRRLFESSAG
jgi:farnesyl-diphosphate farnesyltransferase